LRREITSPALSFLMEAHNGLCGGADLVRAEIAALEAEGALAKANLPELLTRLASRSGVTVHYVTGHWLDVDDLADLAEARNFP
jgi:phosphoenolpyruvate phosphomutase